MRRALVVVAVWLVVVLSAVVQAQTNRPPVAAFTFAPANPVSGQAVTFTNTSTDADGDVLQYWWTFGDGQTSAAGNPTITYASAGTYTVELTAIDNHGPTSTVSQTIVVAQPSQLLAPVVQVVSATASRPAGATATATFSVRNDNGTARSYALAPTSSNTAIVANPAGPAQVTIAANTSANVTLTYQVSTSAAASSTSVIALQATDTGDATKTHTASFTHTTEAAQTNQRPVAAFTYAPSNPVVGQAVTFTNTSTDADGDVLQFWWTFGDGQTSPDGSPTITYATAGTYTVELTAIDNHGPTTSVSKTIVVSEASAPIASPQVTLIASTPALPAGSAATARFSVKNPNATTRTYAFQATSVNHAVVADPADPASIDIAAGATMEVSIAYTVAASAPDGSTSLLRLAAADAGDHSKWHSATFTHTTAAIAAPTLTVVSAPASTAPGNSAAAVFSIRNPNGTARTYAFVATSANTAVVADPDDPASLVVEAGATKQVVVAYQVAASAAVSSTASIALKATDTASTSATQSIAVTHTTAQVIAAPLVAFPNGWVSGLRNTAYTVPMQVTNASNVARTLCFTSSREPGYSNDVDNVTVAAPLVPGCQSFAAGETKTLPVSYTMANSNWDGDTIFAVVTASDPSHAAASTTAKFKISVLMAAESPAPAVLQAGRSYTYVYRFFNQDKFQTAHTYDVTHAVTGAAVFQNLDVPARVTIPAGAWGSVSVTFTVPASIAGQTGALSLRLQDVDPHWPDRTGTAMSSVTAIDVVAPSVSLPDGWTHGLRNQSYVARLVVRNNTNAPRRLCFESSRAAGSGGTPDTVTVGNPTVPPCQLFEAAETKTLQIGYTMANSDWDGDGVQAFITAYDEGDPTIRDTGSTKISVLMNVEPPAPAALQAGATYTQRYHFFNQDRLGTAHTYTVTHTATPGLFQNVSHAQTVSIPAGAWGDVDVTFTLPSASAGQTGALEVQLKDVDPHWPDRIGRALGSVTSIEVLPPSIQLPDGWQHGLRGQAYSVRLVATNNTAAPRTLCFSSERAPGGGGNADNVTTGNPTVPPCQLFGANETRTLPVGYTMANSDWDGDGTQVTIHAWDEQDVARRASEWFKISVLMASNAPVPATLEAGVTHTLRYGFYNQDRFGMAHTYNVVTSVSGDPIFQGIHAPATVTIDAGTWGDVAVAFTVPAGSVGHAGTLTVNLTDVEPTWPDRIGIASASAISGTISIANPTVTAPAGETAPPGSQRTATFQVKNNSSASRTFAFAASSSNTSVVPDPLDPASRAIAAGATETVSVQYTVFGSAAAGSSAAITLAATDVTDTTRSGSATFVVTVATAPAPSDKFTGYSIFPSNLDHPTGIPIQLGAGHLDARQYRQWIGWQGCAPDWYPNGDPDIAYTPNVPQFAAAHPGKLYIFLDEPAHGTVWNHRAGTPTGCRQVTPEQYARAYHAFVQSVRAADPTARFSPAGFEQFRATAESYPTAFVEYAAEFAQKYQQIYGAPAPVDEWRFHVYWEWWPDPSDITHWRDKANVAIRFANDRNTPVVLGIGYPWQEIYDARMLDGMSNMFAYLKDHSGVASVFWFSYDEFHDGHNRLTTHTEGGGLTRTLTPLGERYRSLIQGLGTPSPGSAVAVTPDAMNAFSAASTPGTQQFRVQNIGASTATYQLTQSCSGAVTNCATPNPSQVTLSPGQASDVSVSYTMSASGSGSLTLNAVQSGVAGVNDSGSYQLTATAPASDGFDLSMHNGENVDTTQFASTLSYATTPYFSMDQPRGVTLFYSSAQSNPRALIQVEVNDPVPPQQYSVVVKDASGAAVAMSDGSFETFYEGGSGGKSRLAAHLDTSQLNRGGGAYDYKVIVRRWNNGVAADSLPQWARVLVANERNSPHGAGWSILGLQRIHIQPDQSLVVTSGDGTALYFARPAGCSADCTYTTPNGDWTTVSGNGSEFVRTYRDGSRVVFDSAGYQTSTIDLFGNTTRYLYEGGRLKRIIDPVSANQATPTTKIDFAYGTGSYTITDAAGRVTTVRINAAGDVVSIGPDTIRAIEMQDGDYTSDHRLLGYTDRLGGRWDFGYDHLGMLASITKPAVTADGVANVRPRERMQSLAAAVMPPQSLGTTSRTNAAPRIVPPVRTWIADARDAVTWMSVDRFGSSVAMWNALDQVTKIDRDERSLVRRIETPSGAVTRYDYHPGTPLLKQVTDEVTRKVMNYEYETFDRPKRVWGTTIDSAEVTADTPETTYTYESKTRFSVKTKRADGTFATQWIDLTDDGRLMMSSDAEGHEVSYSYMEVAANPWKNLTHVAEGADGSRLTKYEYDAAGRVWSTTFPSDAETVATVRLHEYDTSNRLRFTELRNAPPAPLKQVRTTYVHTEEAGKVTQQVIDAKSNVYTTVFNALGWVERQTDPRGKSDTYEYDKAGNVLASVNRRNQRLSWTHDALGRPKTMVDHELNNAQTTWDYDTAKNLWLKIANGESVNLFTFDAAGRPLQEQITLTGVAGGPYTVASQYNHATLQTRTDVIVSAPSWSPRTVHYEYDREALLRQVRDLSGATTIVTHSEEGRMSGIHFPVGVTAGFFPTSHHVAAEITYDAPAATIELGVGYTIDALGRIRMRWNPTRTEAQTYKFDFAGRLEEVLYGTRNAPLTTDCKTSEGGVCVERPLNSARTHLFQYDPLGNRTDTNAQLESGGGNRMIAFGPHWMSYDDDGNLASKGGQIFAWDGQGQLRFVTTAVSSVSYGYDGLGRRVRKSVTPGTTTHYLYDGQNLFAEVDAAGNAVREYTFFPKIDAPLSVRQGGSTYYYLTELPGHVSGLVDATGNPVNRYTYGPWGETNASEAIANPLRFGAREHDSETGLYYHRARYYDPSIGRFISEDPIGLAGGMNPYEYAGSDPINRLDPTGQTGKCITMREYQDMSDSEKDAFLKKPNWCSGAGAFEVMLPAFGAPVPFYERYKSARGAGYGFFPDAAAWPRIFYPRREQATISGVDDFRWKYLKRAQQNTDELCNLYTMKAILANIGNSWGNVRPVTLPGSLPIRTSRYIPGPTYRSGGWNPNSAGRDFEPPGLNDLANYQAHVICRHASWNLN